MVETIVGIFDSNEGAESATNRIKDSGLKTDEISIVRKENVENEEGHDNISRGTVTGGGIGGVAGLLLGMGTIAVPGLGVLAAAGPIAGALAGVVTGGVVGSLVDLGIPEDAGTKYEDEIIGGAILWSMSVNENNGGAVSKILKESGARSVEVHRH